MMNFNEMVNGYRATSAAMAYIVGFALNNILYRIVLDELPDEILHPDHESTKNGGHYKIKMHCTNTIKARWIENGAEEIGTVEMLDGVKNKGNWFEKLETERVGQVWVKDSIPYYVQGDLSVNGIEYQIKWENASLTNESVIRKALEWKLSH